MGEILKKKMYKVKNNLIISCVLAFSLVCLVGFAQAGTMPVYERLEPLIENINAPTAVALDKSECIFVAESINNRVLIYSQSGQYMNELLGLNRPISVAVDDNARIFVGNKNSKNVEAYDGDLRFLFKLGSGDGEFKQPNDIAIDNAGRIFVVDKSDDIVKVYNSDGSYSTFFGAPGNGDGKFHNPTSIAIDKATEELIVLDHQLTADMFGNQSEGARIQVFDMNGGFKRSFSPYGNQIGQMFRPQHVTVDGQSRLYVTDSFHNVVLLYDSNGTYLGDLYDAENPMRTPLGITMGSNNRIYVSSLLTKKVEMYGVDLYTRMEVTPLNLNLQGYEGGINPEVQGVEVSNSGKAVLNITASTANSWISLSEAVLTIQPGEALTVNVGVDLNGLAPGTYTGNVSIRASTGATEIVRIALEVVPAPEMTVVPATLTFTAVNGSIPSAQTLTVSGGETETLEWAVAMDRNWIVTDKTGGISPENLMVAVDIASLSSGTHTGAVTVTGQGVLSGPVIVPVILNVTESTGTINVTTNLEGASFTISGPQFYSGSGMNWSKGDAPTGTYSIVYGTVDGYVAPPAESQLLGVNATLSFYGEYTSQGEIQQSNMKNIIVGAGPGEQNAGLVKVFQSDGVNTGIEFMAHGYNNGVNVAAGDINCDGIDEIITAPGPGPDNPAEVRIYDRFGHELTNLGITVFPYAYGVNVASGDLNGDGEYEVLAGAGTGLDNPAEVKVYVYDSSGNSMVDSGIDLLAFDFGYGVNVAAGDVDGDGRDEIITSPGTGEGNPGIVRIWRVNTSAGIGQWSTEMIREVTVTGISSYSVSVGSGDMNGDGVEEVLTGDGPDLNSQDRVTIFDGSGQNIYEFRAYVAKLYGVNIASGDIDNDGVDEIVAAPGAGSRDSATVKIFDEHGIEVKSFLAMESWFGLSIAVGDLDLP